MQRGQHWEEELHAAAQVPLHFATKATTGTAVAPNRWPPRRWGTSGAQKNWGPRGRGSQTSDPLLLVPATWCLGTIPRSSKGCASWREEEVGAEKKQRGDGEKNRSTTGGRTRERERLVRGEENRARERRSLRAGFHWCRRAEKEIERGRGEACARVSIGAADSKRASHAKNGQRRLRDGER